MQQNKVPFSTERPFHVLGAAEMGFQFQSPSCQLHGLFVGNTGFFGFPRLEVAGAAIASVIGITAGAIMSFVAVMHGGHLTEARPAEGWTREAIGLAMAGAAAP